MPDDEQKPEEKEPQVAPGADEDKFRPEAIAARVDHLGTETEADRVAREEEAKLLERKRQTKGKRGLEAAASKRLAKIGEGTVKRPSRVAGAAVPEADPILERAALTSEWIKEHRELFGAVVAIAVLALAGGLGWTYWQNKHQVEASAILAQAFADERGHVTPKQDDEEEESARPALYPTFKSVADRRAAALAKYREVETKYAGTGAAYLAKLGEAGLLLDMGDAKGALQAYQDAKNSALAQADAQVRGRALEGVGFADELLSETDAAAKDKHLDDAFAAFKQLEQVDARGFKELGMYHQARILQDKGDKAKAIELLKDVHKRVTEPGENHPFAYLEFVVEDRLRALDPSALPPKASKLGGPAGNLDMSDPQIQQLIRQFQQQQQQKGGAPK